MEFSFCNCVFFVFMQEKKIVLAVFSTCKEKEAKHRTFLFLLVIHIRTVEKLVQATEQNRRFFNFGYPRPCFHAQCIEITHSEQKRLVVRLQFYLVAVLLEIAECFFFFFSLIQSFQWVVLRFSHARS